MHELGILMATKLLLLLLFCLFSIRKALSLQPNISSGSTLYTNSTPSFWPSPSGHFAFGFYPTGNGFKVGIWVVGSPKNTIVWTSRRNDPVISPGAALVFSTDGRLLLLSSTGQVQPVAETTQTASVASMHDSGNFVLYNSSSKIIWASFDSPTDTLLVLQKLVPENMLYSSISETDTSIGNFKLSLNRDGSLYAFPIRSLQDVKYIYWSSFSKSIGRNLTLNLAADSRFYLSSSSGLAVLNLTAGGHLVDGSKVLYRATFDVDGILRLYRHQMGSKGSSNISILWEAITPENRCSVKGICGPNSFCSVDGADLSCLCPPGFEFVDPKQANIGCKLNSTAKNDCFGDKGKANYRMTSLPNTAWESGEYDLLSSVNEEACSENCLEDCNCVVATFWDEMCFKQKLPLRFGRRNGSRPTKALVKITRESLPDDTNVVVNEITKKLGKKLVIVGVVLITLSIFLFLFSGYLIFKYQIWGNRMRIRKSNPPDVVQEINVTSFTYDQLVKATNNFREEIGRGASGKVYKGSLQAMNGGGQEIAVKRLEKMVEERESVFKNEMKIIGRTHHKNLLQLIGFCSEGSNRLLVYEFMKNGSLGDLLFKSRSRPSWNERRRILVEIARGIHYLHEECQTRIIHCDIKPHNILMDESGSAKISDFGLSKLLKPDQTKTYTMARGTRGYVAPEWDQSNAPITVKADVYSFGVLLLEIVCCRKNLVLAGPEEEMVLTDWVYKCYLAGELEEVVDETELDMEELEKVVKVGLWCVHTEAALRPSMKSVIMMLEGTVVTQAPPPPSSHVNV
jgi:hypothetical protein